MIEFTLAGESVISISGYLADVPDPIGVYLTGLDYQIYRGAPNMATLNGIDFPNNFYQVFAFDNNSWGAIQTTAVATTEGAFNTAQIFEFNDRYLYYRADASPVDTNIPILEAFEFELSLNNAQTTGVVPINFEAITPSVIALVGAASSIQNVYFGDQLGTLGGQSYEGELNTWFGFAGLYSASGFEVFNTWLVEGAEDFEGYFDPTANFTTDVEGVYQVFGKGPDQNEIQSLLYAFNPYVNWHDGDFTNGEKEAVAFDSEGLSYAIENFLCAVLPMNAPNPDRFFILFDSGDDQLALAECFPALLTYNIYRFVAVNGVAARFNSWLSYFNGEFTFEYNAPTGEYRFNGLGSLYYGVGIVGSQPAETVPQYAPVKLPCIVSCIPLIDRRL